MTTLNVVIDEMLATPRNGISFYTEELARGLIEYAPSGCFVEGIVASSTEQEYAEIASRLPGLSGLFKSALTRRDLTAAWQHGFTPVPSGMIHAPSLFAPLRNHDRLHSRSSQIAVTIHDLTAWTHPEFLTSRQVSWAKAMTQRAYRYADAIVLPTHAVAAELGEILDFGDRVRVIGGAVRPSLAVPENADLRVATLELPDRYLLAMGDTGPRHGIESLLAALAITTSDALPLLVVGGEHQPGALAAAATAAGLAEGRVRSLGQLDDADLAVVLDRATVFVYPPVATRGGGRRRTCRGRDGRRRISGTSRGGDRACRHRR
jgi:hypothetical protein